MPLSMAQVASSCWMLFNRWLKLAIAPKISATTVAGLLSSIPTFVLMAISGRFIAIAFSNMKRTALLQPRKQVSARAITESTLCANRGLEQHRWRAKR